MSPMLQNAMTTIKNTMKWEFSSKLIHGVESAFSSAIGYVTDLNKTLTDIRIVTGASIADMAQFTKTANQMATELSSTTKEVAKASLIYYQQGDDAETALKKAAVTTKAANVAFTASAQEMSQMLTAVWNSYKVGEEELETVVDAVAALGATTASSMEEIMTAMQKVSSTASTVGVSINQMSSIIATVASVTRQSADTVGTSWKTLLARFSSLKLGETLEDGVSLTKYTSALQSIGVNVLDVTGNLRDMGDVINDIGAAWQTLTTAQKTAVSQTVGGVRQMNQLIAFFDNFDQYQKNLNTANMSEGTLQAQNEIFASGYEAAANRAETAMQKLYSVLADESVLTGFQNTMANVTNTIADMVEGLGGVPAILALVANALSHTFSAQIATRIGTMATSMQSFFSHPIQNISNAFSDWNARRQGNMTKAEQTQYNQIGIVRNQLQDQIGEAGSYDNQALQEQLTLQDQILQKKQELLSTSGKLSQADIDARQSALELATQELDQINQQRNAYEQLAAQKINVVEISKNYLTGKGTDASNLTKDQLAQQTQAALQQDFQSGNYQQGQQLIKDFHAEETMQGLTQVYQKAEMATQGLTLFEEGLMKVQSSSASASTNQITLTNAFSGFETVMQKAGIQTTEYASQLENVKSAYTSYQAALKNGDTDAQAAAYTTLMERISELRTALTSGTGDLGTILKDNADDANSLAGKARAVAEALVGIYTQSGKVKAGLDSAFNDSKISSFGAKVGSAFSKLTSGLSGAIASFSSMSSLMSNWDTSSVTSKATSIASAVLNIANSKSLVEAAFKGVAAIVGGVLGAIEADAKRAAEALKELNAKVQEGNTTNKKNISDYNDQRKTLEDLYKQLLEGEDVNDRLKAAANDLGISYLDLMGTTDQLTISTQKLADSIANVTKETRNRLLLEAEATKNDAEKAIRDTKYEYKSDNQVWSNEIDSSGQVLTKESLQKYFEAEYNDFKANPEYGNLYTDLGDFIKNWALNGDWAGIVDANGEYWQTDFGDMDLDSLLTSLTAIINAGGEIAHRSRFNDNGLAVSLSDLYENSRFAAILREQELGIDDSLVSKLVSSGYGGYNLDSGNLTLTKSGLTNEQLAKISQSNNQKYAGKSMEEIIMGSNAYKNGLFANSYGGTLEGNWSLLLSNQDSAQYTAEAYENLLELQQILNVAGFSDTDIFKQLTSYTNSMKETVQAYNDAMEIFESAWASGIGTDLGLSGQSEATMGLNDYAAKMEHLEENARQFAKQNNYKDIDKATEQIVSQAESYIYGFDNYRAIINTFKQLAQQGYDEDKLQQLQNEIDEKISSGEYSADVFSMNAIKDLYNDNTENRWTTGQGARTLNKNATLITQSDLSQKYESLVAAQSYNKNKMSDDDLIKLSTAIDWESYGTTYSEFMTNNYQERAKILKSWAEQELDAMYTSLEAQLTQINTELENAKTHANTQNNATNAFGETNKNALEDAQAFLGRINTTTGDWTIDTESTYVSEVQTALKNSYQYALKSGNGEEWLRLYENNDWANLNQLSAIRYGGQDLSESLTQTQEAKNTLDDLMAQQKSIDEELTRIIVLKGQFADETEDGIAKLSSAFSALPTSASDMSSLLSLLSDNGIYKAKYNGRDLEKTAYTAQDLFGLSDSERESLMIEAAKAEYAKLTDENEKSIKANEIKKMEDTHATNEQNRDLRDETTLLSQLKSEASALSSIDIAKAPKAGTAAYKALNKEIQDMNKYLNATDLEKVGMLYSAQRSNLQEQISTQQMFADRYNTKADGTSYGFTLDQDITKLDTAEFAQWQKWSAVQQEIVALQEKITESYESESEKRITILEAEASAIQTRLSKAKEEAQKLETAASTLSNAVESGKLTATDKLSLSDEQIAKWDTLTTAEERAAYAAQLYADAVIASDNAYKEYNKSIQTARDILTSNISNSSWMSDYYNQKVTSSSDFTKIFGNNETLLSAYESAIKDKTIDSSSTVGEVIKAVQTKLTQMGEEGETAAKKIEAAGVDAMLNIYKTAVEKEQSAADQAVQAWQNAFNTIAAARKSMYENGSLSKEDLTDATKLAAIAQSAGYKSTNEFMQDYRSGKITGDSFRQLRFDANVAKQAAGINTMTEAIGHWDAHQGEYHGYNSNVSYDDAVAQLMTQHKDWNKTKAEEEYDNALKQMFKASGMNDDAQIQEAIDGYKNNLEGYVEKVYGALHQATDSVLTAGKNAEMYDEYEAVLERTAATQKEIEETQAEATKQRDKYQNYSTLANNVFSKSSTAFASSTLGENQQLMLDAMNQLFGTNKSSVNDFTSDQWSRAAAEWDNMAAQEQSKIADAASSLANTLQEAADLIAEIMGTNSKEAETAQTTADTAKETATSESQKAGSLVSKSADDTRSRWASYIGVDESKMDELATAFENLDTNTTVMKEDTAAYREELYKCAAMVEQTRAALDKLSDTYEDNIKTLKKGQTSTDDYIDAMSEVKQNIADIFNVEKKYITDDFVTEHLSDYEDLAKGVEGAADKISTAIRDEIIGSEKMNQEINLDIDMNGTLDQFGTIKSIFDDFQNNYSNIEIGTNIDTSSALAGLDALLASGVMTADEITAALNAIGWEPEIDYEEIEVDSADAQEVNGQVVVQLPGGGTATGILSGSEAAEGKTKVLIPHLKSATRTGTGGSRTNSNSSSGSGGGGSNKTKQKKDSHDQTRYHQTDRLIKNQNDLLTVNDKLKSRKYGTSYIDSLKEENSLLEDQIKLNEEKIKEANAYLQQDKQELLSLGATFDTEGNINYDAYQDYWDSLYNSKVDAYNAGSLDDDAWTDFEEQYNNAMDAVENYEEAQDRIAEAQQEILELQNQISANLKEMAIYKMNLTIDLNDRELKLLENLIKRYEGDLKEQANNYGHYMEEMNNYLENLGAEQTAIDDLLSSAGLSSLEDINGIINGMLNGGKMTVADFADGLDQIYDKLLNDLDAIIELRQEMLEFYANTLEKGEEELEHWTNTLAHQINMMEKYKTILDLISDGKHYERTNEILQQQYDTGMKQIEIDQEKLKVYYEEREKLQSILYNPDGTINEKAEGDLKALEEQIQQTEENIMQNAEATMKYVQEIFTNTIDQIFDDLDRLNTSTGETLSWIKQTKWDWWKEDQDQFVDSITEVYEIDKLTRKIEQSIAESRSKYNQEQLKALENEIQLRSEANDLTQYDLKMMEYSYELLLARQNLENAQNAKDTVRLTRDENGNMIYQYTTDQDKLAEAQQKYNDVLYEMNQTTKERYRDLMDTLFKLREDEENAIKEVLLDTSLSEEEKLAHIEEIKKRYAAQISIIQEQLNIATENMLYNQEAFSERFSQDLIDNTNNTQQQVNLELQEMVTDANTWNQNVEHAIDESIAALQVYQQSIATVADAAGASWDHITERMQYYKTEAEKAKEEANKVTQTLKEQLAQLTELTASWSTFDAQLQARISYFQNLASQINTATAALQALHEEESRSSSDSSASGNGGYTGGDGSGNGNGSGDGSNGGNTGGNGGNGGNTGSGGSHGYTVFVTLRGSNGKSYSGSNSNADYNRAYDWAYRAASEQMPYGVQITSKSMSYERYLQGGLADFTGPAWLDGSKTKPEYVLNADQTEQMFGILNSNTITRLIDTMTMATRAMMAGLGLTSSGSIINNNSNRSSNGENTYYITANFPDAKDHTEIELALQNLMNYSSQQYNSLTL